MIGLWERRRPISGLLLCITWAAMAIAIPTDLGLSLVLAVTIRSSGD
jgi:hypothetical protein